MGLNATLLGAQLAGAMAQAPSDSQPSVLLSGQGPANSASNIPYYLAQPANTGSGPIPPPSAPPNGPYAPAQKLDPASIGTSAPPVQQSPLPASSPQSDNVGEFIGGPKSLAAAKQNDAGINNAIDALSGNVPEGPSIVNDLKTSAPVDPNQARLDAILNSAPKEDPRIQVSRDAATELLSRLDPSSPTFLAPPKYPGMSIGQALVGIAGAIATQGNPHAQFVSQYMQGLGQAVQQQYGNTLQAWQVAREAIKDQAQNLMGQANSLQNYQAEIYKANIGPYGKGVAAQIGATERLSAAQIASAAKVQVALQNGVSGDARQLIRNMGSGQLGPDQMALTVQELQKIDPRFQGIDPQVIAQAIQTPMAKQLLEQSSANLKNSQASLAQAKTATETALLQPRIDDYKAKFDLQEGGAFAALQKGFDLDAEAKKTIEQTKELPEDLANKTIIAKSDAQKAQAYADNIAHTAVFQDGQLQIGQDKLKLDQAINRANQGKAAAQSLSVQASSVRAQGEKMIQGAAAFSDTQVQQDQIAQGQRLLGTANSLQQQSKETFDAASKALSKVQWLQDKGGTQPVAAGKYNGPGSRAVGLANQGLDPQVYAQMSKGLPSDTSQVSKLSGKNPSSLQEKLWFQQAQGALNFFGPSKSDAIISILNKKLSGGK